HLEREGIEPLVLPSRPPKHFTGTHAHVARPWLARSFSEIAGLLEQERHRYLDFLAAADCDLVYLQRDLQQDSWSRLDEIAPLFHDRIVFDFDDAIYMRPSHRFGELEDAAQQKKIEGICALASRVIVATPFLEEWAKKHNARVSVIPTPI